MKKRVIIIAVIVLVLVLGLGLGLWYYKANSLTDKERFAVNVISDYKTKLKTPSSLNVFEIVWMSGDYIMFDSSAKNGYGGDTREITLYSLEDGFFSDKDDYIGILVSGCWEMREMDLENWFIQLDVEKVMKHVK